MFINICLCRCNKYSCIQIVHKMSAGNQLPNLEKIFRDDDETDFLPSSGSNLAAIFGTQSKGLDLNFPEKHVIQKKPIHNGPQSVSSSKTEVIIAKAVHAYKLENGKYILVGKLGMALTGNLTMKTYQIILYKSKQDHVSVVTVTYDFSYIVQPNNYSTYYDSNSENWSILFESAEACTEFAREVGLARYFSKQDKTDICYQDLSPVTKDVNVKEGCSVTLRYFIATEILQPCKNIPRTLQTMTVEISTDDNWERNLLGANEGLRRILFLPPSKQISLGPGFPKDRNIMLAIQVMDIQIPEDTSLKSRHGSSGKASILSRMAKMGQSMFPKVPISTTTDSEDTEDDIAENYVLVSAEKTPSHKKMEPLETVLQKKKLVQETLHRPSKNVQKTVTTQLEIPSSCPNPHTKLVSTSTFTSQWPPTQFQSNYITSDGQVSALQPQILSQSMPTVIDPALNMFLSENRMMNTELRIGMNKIADNVQKVLDKFHAFELQHATTTPTTDKTMEATLKMLLAVNIPKLRTDEVEDKNIIDNINAQDLNRKYEELLVQIKEKDSKIVKLESRLEEYKGLTADNTEYVDKLKEENRSLMKYNDELSARIRLLETSLETANDQLKQALQDLEASAMESDKSAQEKAETDAKISKLTMECDMLRLTALPPKEKDSKNREIKHIMNKAYHVLMEKFEEESYPSSYIKSAIADTIKSITLQVLQEKPIESEASKDQLDTDICKSYQDPELSVDASEDSGMIEQATATKNSKIQ